MRQQILADASTISKNGNGQTPINKTINANASNIASSRGVASFKAATVSFAVAPNIARLYIHKV